MLDGLSATEPCGASTAPLAVHGASETCVQQQKTRQSEACQAEFQRVEHAAAYNLRYQRNLLKRSATPREYSLIDRHIRRVGHMRVVLDIPCGDGPQEAGVKT